MKELTETCLLLHIDWHSSFIVPELLGLLESTDKKYSIEKIQLDTPVKYSIITTTTAAIDYVLSKSILISRAVRILLSPNIQTKGEKKEITMNIVEKLRTSLSPQVVEYVKSKVKGDYKIECLCSNKAEAIEYTIAALGIDHSINLSSPTDSIYVIEEEAGCIIGVLYKESSRKSHLKYSVKQRKFIGNTSMDNEISFIVCNAAGVSHKTVVLDCYAGSGSILLSAALHGALVMGTDINSRQFKGREVGHTNSRIKTQLPNTDIHCNFRMYGVSDRVLVIGAQDVFGGIIIKDSTVDVILCDPPYGERETVKKRDTDNSKYVTDGDDYLVCTIPFLDRVIEIGKKILRDKGRIGIFLPHKTGFAPALKEIQGIRQITQAEQYLNSVYSRTFFLFEVSK